MKLRNTWIALGIGAETATGLSLLKVNKDLVIGSTDVVFGAAVTAIGSHYSTSTGRFTAPVAGNYYFSFYGMSPHADTTNIRCYFKINGALFIGKNIYAIFRYILLERSNVNIKRRLLIKLSLYR